MSNYKTTNKDMAMPSASTIRASDSSGNVTTSVKVIFYSTYGHVYEMAREVAEGASEVPEAKVDLLQVPELMPEETLQEIGAKEAREAFSDVPEAPVRGRCHPARYADPFRQHDRSDA